MEKDLPKTKYLFPKKVAVSCRILWKTRYGGSDSRMNNANDRVAFRTTSEEGTTKNEIKCYNI